MRRREGEKERRREGEKERRREMIEQVQHGQEKHQTHYSALVLHRKCPQAWYYRYGLKLEQATRIIAPERDLGSWWSAVRAAEALERGRKLNSLKATPTTMRPVDRGPEFHQRTMTVASVLDAASTWWENHQKLTDENDERAEDIWEARLGDNLPDRLRVLLENWQDQWADEIANEQPLAVELFWKRELPYPDTDVDWADGAMLADQPRLVLIGYIDELYYDTQRDMVVLRDNKTSKSLSAQTALDDMMDSQLQVYAWGVAEQMAHWNVKSVAALAYDRTRSVKPTTPVLTKSGQLSKQVTQYDLRTYREFVGTGVVYDGLKKDGSGAGIYHLDPTVIERLSSTEERSKWFQRTLVPRNLNVLRAHLRAALDTARDQWMSVKRAESRGETARNLSTNNCRWCDYAPLCRAQMVGGPDGEYNLAEYGLRGPNGLQVLNWERPEQEQEQEQEQEHVKGDE